MSAPNVTSTPLTDAFELCHVDVDAHERVLSLPGGGPYIAPDARLEGKTGRAVWALGPRGHIRAWWLVDGALWAWGPVYTGVWPELDAEVARALGVRVVPFALAGSVVVFGEPPPEQDCAAPAQLVLL